MSEPMSTMLNVVLIDDELIHLDLVSMLLRSQQASDRMMSNFNVIPFTDPAEALANLPIQEPTVIVCDYRMPCGTALDWIDDFLKAGVGPFIVLTAHGDEKTAAQAFRAGASNYLIKTHIQDDPCILIEAVLEAHRRYHLQLCNRDLANQIKRANGELAHTNAKLRTMTETAHRFVDDVAHEFRTPLTVIKEFAAIIGDGLGGPVTEQQREYLQFIDSATRDLAQMVDDFLDTSKIRARSLRVDRTPVLVHQIFDAIRPMLQKRAELRNIRIEERIEANLNRVFCDAEKVGRVLVNLAVNAIKFSDEGGQVRLWAEAEPNGDVRLGVSDDGPGMNEEQLQRVGERFGKVDHTQQPCEKGFGLGLNIASDLMWLNFGQMHVQSEPGQGSTFAVTLPCFDYDRVLDTFVRFMCKETADVSLTQLSVMPAGSDIHTEQLRRYITSICHPMDLSLVSLDSRSIVLVGACDEPDQWMTRLRHVHQEARTCGRNLPVGAFDVQWIGTWKQPDGQAALTESVTRHLLGVKRCA